MDPREDDDIPYDDSDENDPLIRNLRNEMVRLEAQLDQLMAGVRERAEEAEDLRARMEELEKIIDRIKSRYRRASRFWGVIGLMWGISAGIWIGWLLK